jgi:hypothetical protein
MISTSPVRRQSLCHQAAITVRAVASLHNKNATRPAHEVLASQCMLELAFIHQHLKAQQCNGF